MCRDIPIIITVKKHSLRCDGKNEILLRYTLSWLNSLGYHDNVIIVTDNNSIIPDGWRYIIDTSNIDCLLSARNCLKLIGDYEWFYFIPVTQPFRDDDIFEKLNIFNKNEYDFITTFSEIQNRKIFILDDDGKRFLYDSKGRKGKYCPTMKMIDGSAYLISSSFIMGLDSNIINECFWNGNFYTVRNNSFYLDVDYPNDLEIFKKISGYE